MSFNPLFALSPLDGRYHEKVDPLRPIFSEYGLIYYRLYVEIQWLITLSQSADIPFAAPLSSASLAFLQKILTDFSQSEAEAVKSIEKTTNHDVKAIEYYLQDKLSQHNELRTLIPIIHFGCTSEDINNLAYALMINTARHDVMVPTMQEILTTLKKLAKTYARLPMLARTHGQPASPTTLGKEFVNVADRLDHQLHTLASLPIKGKFNGAVGNFNAHCSALPKVNWPGLSEQFVKNLGLQWNPLTTQIEPHDNLAEFLHALMRFNTILIDLNRDIWAYISIGYFSQRAIDNEVGSSTMPHKINPIDFENSEGNLGVANAIASHLAQKLPISRWQRDLTDSTVLRNLGIILGYALIAYKSTLKGLSKIHANEKRIKNELEMHWEVLAEAVQTVMRAHGIEDAYEQLKAFTRGKPITKPLMHKFIDQAKIPPEEKKRLKMLTPSSYIGYAEELTIQGL